MWTESLCTVYYTYGVSRVAGREGGRDPAYYVGRATAYVRAQRVWRPVCRYHWLIKLRLLSAAEITLSKSIVLNIFFCINCIIVWKIISLPQKQITKDCLQMLIIQFDISGGSVWSSWLNLLIFWTYYVIRPSAIIARLSMNAWNSGV